MALNEITPEERLLKVIESPTPSSEGKAIAFGFLHKKGQVTNLFDRLKRLKDFKAYAARVDLRVISRILMVVCALLTIFCAYDFIRVNIGMSKRLENIITGGALSVPVNEEAIKIVTDDIDQILAQLKSRNLFTFLPPKTQVQVQAEISAAFSDLKLVGVLWSDTHPQAMVENSKEQKTYLVNNGDKVGSFNVKTIYQNKVVIEKEGREWDLM